MKEMRQCIQNRHYLYDYIALMKGLHWLSPIVTFIHFQTFNFIVHNNNCVLVAFNTV